MPFDATLLEPAGFDEKLLEPFKEQAAESDTLTPQQRIALQDEQPFPSIVPPKPFTELAIAGGPPLSIDAVSPILPLKEKAAFDLGFAPLDPESRIDLVGLTPQVNRESDTRAMGMAKTALQAAVSLPEFFTSDAGISTLGLGAIPGVRRLVGAYWTQDLVRSAYEQAKQATSNWDRLTEAEKGQAIINFAVTSGLAAGSAGLGMGVKPRTVSPAALGKTVAAIPKGAEGAATAIKVLEQAKAVPPAEPVLTPPAVAPSREELTATPPTVATAEAMQAGVAERLEAGKAAPATAAAEASARAQGAVEAGRERVEAAPAPVSEKALTAPAAGETVAGVTTKPFEVDEQLVMRSPHTGEDTLVSYRGKPESGQAVVWTGRSQMQVPESWLRRQGEKYEGQVQPTAAAPSVVEVEKALPTAEGVREAIQPAVRLSKEGLIEELLGPKPPPGVAMVQQRVRWEADRKRYSMFTKSELVTRVNEQRRLQAERATINQALPAVIQEVQQVADTAGPSWRKALREYAASKEGLTMNPPADTTKAEAIAIYADALAGTRVRRAARQQPAAPAAQPEGVPNALQIGKAAPLPVEVPPGRGAEVVGQVREQAPAKPEEAQAPRPETPEVLLSPEVAESVRERTGEPLNAGWSLQAYIDQYTRALEVALRKLDLPDNLLGPNRERWKNTADKYQTIVYMLEQAKKASAEPAAKPAEGFPRGVGDVPIVGEMLVTAQKSLAELRAQVSDVRYGKPGEILFEFQGKTYSAPEPRDVMPAVDTKGTNAEASRSWALKQVLDKKAKLYTAGAGVKTEAEAPSVVAAQHTVEGATAPASVSRPAAKPAAAKEPPASSTKAGEPAPAPPSSEPMSPGPGAEASEGMVGMGGAVPSEFVPSGTTATAIKNAKVEADRKAMGLPEFEPVMKQDYGSVWEQAKAAVDQDPVVQDNLIAELKAQPRALKNQFESALLHYRLIELKNEYAKATRALAQAFDDGRMADIPELKARVQEWSDKVFELTEITKKVGTEWGRTGVARQQMAMDDFSLIGLELRKRAANDGRPLTDAERAHLQQIAKEYQEKIAELESKLKERTAANSQTEAAKAVTETAATVRTAQAKKGAAKARADVDVDDVKAKIGLKFEREEVGNITPLVKKLAEAFWMDGIRELNPMIDALHGVLLEFMPEITRLETMDALSGRGRFWMPSQDAVKKGVRDMSTQARLVAHQIDVEAGRPMPRTGYQPEKLSDAARREQQKLNELKRRFGVVVTDPAAQLASALQASKTYLRNRMADLRQEISNREKIVKTKTPLVPDAELNRMRAEYEDLKKQHAEIFTRPELTPEQRAAMAERAIDRSIQALEDQLERGDLFPKAVRPVVAETSTLMAKRAWLAALREHRQELRDIANPKKTPEQRALQTTKTRMTNRIAEYQQRLADGDFTQKPKREPISLDDEGLALKADLDKIKSVFEEELAKDKLKNLSLSQKIYEHGKEVLNAPRAAMSSWDVSAVMRQGGFIAFGHPIRAAKSIGPMFRALASEQRARMIDQEIQGRANASLYKRSGLYLAPMDTVRLSAMEELQMARWARFLPGVRASNRAYLTFLNKLRADSFDAMYESLNRPERPLTTAEMQALSNYINVATGRGTLGKTAGAAEFLATTFFSPRLVASRFQMLLGEPLYHGSAQTRFLVAKEYARTLTGLAVMYGLAGMAGASIETDPTSSDFGKLRFGNTRIDPLMGLSQISVLLSRLWTGERKTFTGETRPIRGEKVKYGEPGVGGLMWNFLRSKFSPVIGTIYNLLNGKDWEGKPINPVKEGASLLIPLSFTDVLDVMKEQGIPAGIALQVLSMFGMGLQYYEPRKPKKGNPASPGAAPDLSPIF